MQPGLTHFPKIRQLVGFLSRHRWSVPPSLFSVVFFARLATELRENELGPFDTAEAKAVAGTRGEFDQPMLWLTRIGDGTSMFVIAVLAGAVLLLFRRKRELAYLASVGFGTLLLSVLLKLAFHRARPGAAGLYMIHTPHSYSFPSGHALGSMGVLFGLLMVARAVGVRGAYLGLLASAVTLFVLGVATSRIYFGVHFPSDVIGGLLAGVGWVSAMTGWFYPRALPGEAVTPEAPPPPI
jgi:undecaprenyl-diphosphatase